MRTRLSRRSPTEALPPTQTPGRPHQYPGRAPSTLLRFRNLSLKHVTSLRPSETATRETRHENKLETPVGPAYPGPEVAREEQEPAGRRKWTQSGGMARREGKRRWFGPRVKAAGGRRSVGEDERRLQIKGSQGRACATQSCSHSAHRLVSSAFFTLVQRPLRPPV